VPDALGQALGKYLHAKTTYGMQALLLGEANCEKTSDHTRAHAANGFSLKCPDCKGRLVFEAACANCPACGFSYC
jgi:hypothetical protein